MRRKRNGLHNQSMDEIDERNAFNISKSLLGESRDSLPTVVRKRAKGETEEEGREM